MMLKFTKGNVYHKDISKLQIQDLEMTKIKIIVTINWLNMLTQQFYEKI